MKAKKLRSPWWQIDLVMFGLIPSGWEANANFSALTYIHQDLAIEWINLSPTSFDTEALGLLSLCPRKFCRVHYQIEQASEDFVFLKRDRTRHCPLPGRKSWTNTLLIIVYHRACSNIIVWHNDGRLKLAKINLGNPFRWKFSERHASVVLGTSKLLKMSITQYIMRMETLGGSWFQFLPQLKKMAHNYSPNHPVSTFLTKQNIKEIHASKRYTKFLLCTNSSFFFLGIW